MTSTLHSQNNPYEGVEAPDNFPNQEAEDTYRKAVLDKSLQQLAFIREHFPQAQDLIEACCGNGRLLMALAQHVRVAKGFDLSNSRINFANKWISDWGIDNITVWQDDILMPSDNAKVDADLALCITGSFGYFDAITANGGELAALNLARMLRPGGSLVMELYQHPNEIQACKANADGHLRTWSRLSESDPFALYLSDYHFVEATDILEHKKIFIAKKGDIDDTRQEMLRIYSKQELINLLSVHFEKLWFYKNWQSEPYAEGDEYMILTATRKS